MVKKYGYNCMVTMQSWMFLSSFEKLRKKLIECTTISNLLHMDNMVMKIAFGTSATVFRKVKMINYNSTFYHVKLSDVEKDIVNPLFFNDENKFVTNYSNFIEIPRSPIAYWAENNLFKAFEKFNSLSDYADVKAGLSAGDNNRFFRFWFEVSFNNIGFNLSQDEATISEKSWFPLNKGGSFRKWYGNQDYVINYKNNGFDLRNFKNSTLRNPKYYFKESISWSEVSNSKIAFRKYPRGFLFDGTGSSIFCRCINENFLLAFLNSSVNQYIMDLISPTIHYTVGSVSLLPMCVENSLMDKVNTIVNDNIFISKNDWNDYECSWNFSTHPLIKFKTFSLHDTFLNWEKFKIFQFNQLKSNEIELNIIFKELYNLNVETSIDNHYISVNMADYEKDIISFISYAVGCMFGRYSLDNYGLQFAGGEFNINNYHKFVPDDDNIIPVLDSEYFEDDIVGRFIEFVKTCFGEENLEENLDFIANALSKNKKPSREKIRDYLLKNFFNDHKKTYKKCPIYWQFSSGKENGFNCLVYMHRYEPSLVARIRTDYLHKTQKAIEQRIAACDNIMNHSSSNTEITKATKDKNKLQKQLKETQEYDEALAHIANQNIQIDLDDGVKVNYAKFQNVEVSKEGKKSKKINLLKKL